MIIDNFYTSVLKRRSFDSINRHKNNSMIYIEGHRGCRTQPENTLKSIKKAIEKGCESIELDVWLTKDNVPVVIHGDTNGEINKTTNGTGFVNYLDYDELSRFDAGEGEKIPKLDNVFELCKNQIFLNIELKDNQIEKTLSLVIALIDLHQMRHQVAMSSFKHQYYYELVNMNINDLEFGFLYNDSSDPNSFIYDLTRPNTTCNLNSKYVEKELVETAHKNNVAIQVWFSSEEDIENEEEYLKLIKLGVDILCVNNIEIAIKSREKYLFSNNIF